MQVIQRDKDKASLDDQTELFISVWQELDELNLFLQRTKDSESSSLVWM